MTTCVPPLLDERDLPGPVLRSAVLDGELYSLGDRFRPVDLPADVAARAESLGALTQLGRVLASRTAAWVWGAVPRLEHPCSVVVPSTSPVGHSSAPTSPDLRIRVARLPRSDIAEVAGTRTTTPLRTAIDLLRERDEPPDPTATARLLDAAGLDLDGLVADLQARRRLPGASLAIARAQVLVTR